MANIFPPPISRTQIMDGSGSYNEKTDVYSFGLVMWYVSVLIFSPRHPLASA